MIEESQFICDRLSTNLSVFIAKSYDSLIMQAITLNGWSLDYQYIKDHISKQKIPDGDRFWHDGKPFLEIEVKFDTSENEKIKVKVFSRLLLEESNKTRTQYLS